MQLGGSKETGPSPRRAATSLKLADYSNGDYLERQRAVNRLLSAKDQPLNGEARMVEDRIRVHEERAGMSSDEMKRKLDNGDIEESADICSWLMLLDLRSRVASGER